MNDSTLSANAPLKILIVEDEPKLGQLLVDYLEAAGYATQWLSNGSDVVPLVKANPPAMILLDLMLPGISGLSICRDIRQFSDIPIMMVTAKTEEIDRLLTDRTIDSHIKNLRRKLESIDGDKAFIRAVYGVGYRWEAEPCQII